MRFVIFSIKLRTNRSKNDYIIIFFFSYSSHKKISQLHAIMHEVATAGQILEQFTIKPERLNIHARDCDFKSVDKRFKSELA